MMSSFRMIAKTSLACLAALCILSVFVLIFSYSGIHVSNTSGATDYKWSGKQWKSSMVEGFSWLRMDENGFNNPRAEASIRPDILVMGSSHMEAVNVGIEENTVACLSFLLPEFSIYNIGVSGHEIYQIAKNLRNAVTEYNPQEYVIIETAAVSLRAESMEKVLDGSLLTIPSYDSGVLYYIQKYFPALKCIYKQMTQWNKGERTGAAKTVMGEDSLEIDKDLLSRFLAKMRFDAGEERKLIIFYHPSMEIDGAGNLFFPQSDNVSLFASVCEENEIIFVDMTQEIETLYEEQHILARGFVNTAVGEGHLNEYGHRVIAQRLAEVIMEDQK